MIATRSAHPVGGRAKRVEPASIRLCALIPLTSGAMTGHRPAVTRTEVGPVDRPSCPTAALSHQCKRAVSPRQEARGTSRSVEQRDSKQDGGTEGSSHDR
jgi:hypothetical protein